MSLPNVILDIEGLQLTGEDKELIAHPSVAGVILFSRNFENPAQLHQLTKQIMAIKGPVIIAADQEGGRVVRFKEGFTELPSMRYWSQQYQQNPEQAKQSLAKITRILVRELFAVGVNLSITPVLDLDYGLNQVIGERSFGANPDTVTALAQVVIHTLHSEGMTCVGKHFPGHGGVALDSHVALPVDKRGFDALWQADLQPFFRLLHDIDAIMPAHIIFSAIDEELVSYSHYWLHDVLREKLQFQGVIMSDDLTMNAATHIGDCSARTQAALEAGCDVLIVCNDRVAAIEVVETSARLTAYARNDYLSSYLKKIAKVVI